MIKASSPTKVLNDKKFHLEFFRGIVAQKLGKTHAPKQSTKIPERKEKSKEERRKASSHEKDARNKEDGWMRGKGKGGTKNV
jgi:hypothetical protein